MGGGGDGCDVACRAGSGGGGGVSWSLKEAIGYVPAISLIVAGSALWVSWSAYRVSDANLRLNDPSIIVSPESAGPVGLTDCCLVWQVDYKVFNLRNRPESLRFFDIKDAAENTSGIMKGQDATIGEFLTPVGIAPRGSTTITTFYFMRVGGNYTESYRKISQKIVPTINSYDGLTQKFLSDRDVAIRVFSELLANIDPIQAGTHGSGLGSFSMDADCKAMGEGSGNELAYPHICPSISLATADGYTFSSGSYYAALGYFVGADGAADWGWGSKN